MYVQFTSCIYGVSNLVAYKKKNVFMTMGYKNPLFLIFNIYYVALKIVTYVRSYAGYASQVKFLLRF